MERPIFHLRWEREALYRNSARTIDITRTTVAQQQRPESPTITPPRLRLVQGT